MAEEQIVRNLVLSLCDLKQHGDSPPALVGSCMRCVGTRIYLHGGANESNAYDDLYLMEIEKATWRQLSVGGFSKPTGRHGHSMCAWNNKLILFGGFSKQREEEVRLDETVIYCYKPPPYMSPTSKFWGHQEQPSSDLFILHTEPNIMWKEPETENDTPCPRGYHAAAVASDHLVVFGGAANSEMTQSLDDLHCLDLNTMVWKEVGSTTGQPPNARIGHQLVYHEGSGVLFMFGGANDDGALYSLKLTGLGGMDVRAHWAYVQVKGTAPMSRSFHSCNVVGHKVYVFAGAVLLKGDNRNTANPQQLLDDTPSGVDDLSPSEEKHQIKTFFKRAFAPLTFAGGCCDIYILDITKMRWCRPLYDGQINSCAHTACVLHDKLIIYGGAKAQISNNQDSDEQPKDSPPLQLTITSKTTKKLFFMSVLEIRDDTSPESSDFKFKLVTVGDSAVGKSCLLSRFVQDVYSDFHVSTIGVDYKSVVTMVKGKLCTLQLWDTAGQERFGSVVGNYYRKADGFVMVFDATRRQSFLNIMNWLQQIQEHHECGPNTVKLLIGNKTDLSSSVEVGEKEAKHLATSIGATYIPTSAKTAANVDAAFLTAANALVDLRKKNNPMAKAMSMSSTGSVSLAGGPHTRQPQRQGACAGGGCSSERSTGAANTS